MAKLKFRWLSGLTVSLICLSLFSFTVVAAADNGEKGRDDSKIKHVLLISVDGLHAVDLARYVSQHSTSTLAQLSESGTTYTNASTSKPSDSFPGILSLTTGGSPNSTGVWYDDSYDRTLYAPGSNCVGAPGTEVVYDETVDYNLNALDGGGGIDPNALPLDASKGCTPVYPHQFLRVNTIFEVVQKAGLHTAWSDKHPSYDLLNGPSGKGVEDLYSPEIASGPYTASAANAITYDSLKVQVILNEIDGKDHSGTKSADVPALFGMNFQAVSVGQKTKGYLDGQGNPSADLASALDFVDASLGKFVTELKNQDLFDSTLIIVTAKHGQAPIDPNLYVKGGSKTIPTLVNSVQAGLIAQDTQDDVSLLWLTDQSKTGAVVSKLEANGKAAYIYKVLAGDSLKLLFNDPKKDPRVPDIIVEPNPGVIYTNSTAKIAEHGGFSSDDTNVALLVSNPHLHQQTIKEGVQTTQVAPTILEALGLDSNKLKAVQIEKTPLLPGFKLGE